MANEVALKNEYIFISLDDVLYTHIPNILKLLRDDRYRKEMSSYIDYSKFDNLSDEELNFFCLKRMHKNILNEVAISNFDTWLTLADIMYRNNEYIKNNICMLHMASVMDTLAQQQFTKKIYMYSESADDVKIVSELFGKYSNCYFISGDFKSAIKTIKENITLYIIDDADRVYDLVSLDKVHYTDILIANYGYNYIYDEEQKIPILKLTDVDKLSKANNFRLNMFMPFTKEQLRKPKS